MNYYQDQNESFIMKIAYKLGAKNKKQAEQILLIVAVIVFVVAAYLFYDAMQPDVPF